MPVPEPEPKPEPVPEPEQKPERGRGSQQAAPPRARPASLGLRSRAQPHRGGSRTPRRRPSRRTRTRTTAACPVPSATAKRHQVGSRAGARTRMRPSHPFGLKSCASIAAQASQQRRDQESPHLLHHQRDHIQLLLVGIVGLQSTVCPADAAQRWQPWWLFKQGAASLALSLYLSDTP